MNEAGITKVNQLIFANLSSAETERKLTSISESTGIAKSYIQSYHQQAKTATPGSAPPTINHLDADNPYLSRYGEERWLEKIKGVNSMTTYVDIHDLVRFIDSESAKVYKGTKYESTYL